MSFFLNKRQYNTINITFKTRRKFMLGAIIGDLAGSVYEYEQTQNCHSVKMKNIIEENAFFSDDTILTIAIADAILTKKDYGNNLKKYALEYQDYSPNFKPYFKTPFSPNFTKWAQGDFVGKSAGNGAMMRISPIGFWFGNEKEIEEQVRLATSPSHNCPESISSATTIALIIFYSRKGLSKEEIKSKLNLKITKPEIKTFNYTCHDTIDVCLYSFFNSKSFEDSISLSLSFGGDTDTNACIVGSMAEAYYGIDDELKNKALSYLPSNFQKTITDFYHKLQSRNQNI